MKLIVIALAATLLSLPALYNYGTTDQVSITVTEKERVTSSGENTWSRYLIFTEEGETFQNTDTLFRLKFNSSDVYGSLKTGQSYDCTVYGWRIPFLSVYRNIVECS